MTGPILNQLVSSEQNDEQHAEYNAPIDPVPPDRQGRFIQRANALRSRALRGTPSTSSTSGRRKRLLSHFRKRLGLKLIERSPSLRCTQLILKRFGRTSPKERRQVIAAG